MGRLADEKANVIDLYRAGNSCSWIAKQYGVATSAVTQLLNRNGVRAIYNGKPKVPEEQKAEIVQLYKSGVSPRLISEKFSIHSCTVRDIVRRQGVSLRATGDHSKVLTQAQVAEAVRLYSHGESTKQIGDRFGVYARIVARVLVDRGLIRQRRARGRRPDGQGYQRVLLDPTDPMFVMALQDGSVMEHRLVMARKLGRPLKRSETVHHIDGNKLNNDPSNLQLRQGKHGNGVCLACADCGSRNIRPIPIDDPSETASQELQ